MADKPTQAEAAAFFENLLAEAHTPLTDRLQVDVDKQRGK